MSQLKLILAFSCLLISACSSIEPLTYGKKTYTPAISEAEAQHQVNQIEAIEKRARTQTKEEMMDVAEVINKIDSGRPKTTLILY